jgi:2'-5' RNA ligase
VRLFAAVWPSEEVRAAVSATAQEMREQPAAARWRWVQPEHWHLTLAFYGKVDESKLPELTRRLTAAARRRAPFELELGGVGRFGDRVVWLGVDGDREALRRLADGAVAAGKRTGIDLEDRRFRPHLTLARSRHGADQLLPATVRPVPWPVSGFALVRSQGGPQVRYDTLAEFRLGDG